MLSETTIAALREDIQHRIAQKANVQVHALTHDGTNFVCIVSYEG